MGTNPEATTHRDANHWVSDGNVVLSAISSDKSRTVLFRIHKSLLSDQSDVFETMFGLPQDQESGEADSYESLPLVRMPDTAEQVEALLNALRDPYQFFHRRLLSDTPIRIQKPLFMATKYEMSDLREKLIRIVESEWPMTLEEFEDYEHRHEELTKRKYVDQEVEWAEWPLHLLPEPAAAIALASEFDFPSLLPAAYYDLSRCDVVHDVEWDNNAGYCADACGKPARWGFVTVSVHRKLLRVKHAISEAASDVRGAFHSASSTCQAVPACKGIWSELKLRTSYHEFHTDVLMGLRGVLYNKDNDSKTLPSKLCGSCGDAFKSEVGRVKGLLWSHIIEIVHTSS